MIHVLEIDDQLPPTKVRKLARRYAMTGGVEISLKPGLSLEQLNKIKAVWTKEFESILAVKGEIEAKSSLAGEILREVEISLKSQETR